MDSVETADFGYSFGIKYHLRKSRIGFSTGIEYSTFGEKEKKRLFKVEYFDNIPYVPYPGEVGQFKYYYRQISLPLQVSYCVYDKRTKIFLSFGPQLNYIFAHGINYPADYKPEQLLFQPYFKDAIAKYNSFSVGAVFGIKLQREIAAKTCIGIEPGFFTHLTPILHIENELMQYNYWGSLSISLLRELK